jgi:hypothetical protein
LVAIKIAATVASGRKWPDHTRAAAGEVLWLNAQCGTAPALRDRLAAAGARLDLQSVHIVDPERDVFGLPIHHFSHDLQRLERKLSDTTVAVIDYVAPYVGEDVERAIDGFRYAFWALKDFATKFGIAVIVPCRLPCRGGSTAMILAIDTLTQVPELGSVLLIEGTERGTVVPKKTCAGVDAAAVPFRTTRKHGLAVVWDNPVPVKSPATREPNATESLAGREILNTSDRDPEVRGESSSPVPTGEVSATPSEPAATSATVHSHTTDLARTRAQHQVPAVSANVRKPVFGPTKFLRRKVIVPLIVPYRKPMPGTRALFKSASADEADEKGRRAPKSGGSAKPSAKPPKFRNRNFRKKGKRGWGDPSE